MHTFEETAWWAGSVRATLTVVCLAVACPACGGEQHDAATATGSPVSPLFHSGSRLRARYLDAGDGAVDFVGFRDQELGVDCDFYLGTDAKSRCLPETTGGLFFTDAACTEPVAAFTECDGPPEWYRVAVFSNPTDQCDPG